MTILTDQRIANLSRGTRVRQQRAQLKREVKAGEALVSSTLSTPTLPAYLVGMEVGKLIAAIGGVSYEKACKLCEELRISPLNPLGKLTYRQRRVIASHITSRWEKENPAPTGPRVIQKAAGLDGGAGISRGRRGLPAARLG